MSTFPARYVRLDAARERFGSRVDAMGEALWRGDPLADAVVHSFDEVGLERGWGLFERAVHQGIDQVPEAPEALAALFAEVEAVPHWVDWAEVDKGGSLLLRSTAFGAITLGLKSLVLGYCSPGGNKPLAFSGRLRSQAARRLKETAQFVYAVSVPGGMRQGQAGYAISLRVRLIHARIRQLILSRGQWEPERWGAVISQHDMVATALLFSTHFSAGVAQFGLQVTPEELRTQLALWRYVAWLMGTEVDLLPRDHAEALELSDLIDATQEPPDDDSRALVHALVRAPVQMSSTPGEEKRALGQLPLAYGMCRALLGPELSDHLQLPHPAWRHLVSMVAGVVGTQEWLRSLREGWVERAVERGDHKWQVFLENVLAGQVVQYSLPSRLSGWR